MQTSFLHASDGGNGRGGGSGGGGGGNGGVECTLEDVAAVGADLSFDAAFLAGVCVMMLPWDEFDELTDDLEADLTIISPNTTR